MKPVHLLWSLCCISAACSASPNINVGNEGDGSVAASGGAGGGAGFGGVGGFGGGNEDTLTALITEPPSEMAIEVITISCAGECKQVLAIAQGGNDPYTFMWNDGVTTAAREICADDDTTFTVTAADTAIIDGEFPYAAQTVTADVTADVLQCPADAGVGDAGECEANDGSVVYEDLQADIRGVPMYFANGAALPAGRYRVSYVDGCLKYEAPWPWTVQGVAGVYEFLLIGDTTTQVLGSPPGTRTTLLVAGSGYAEFDACVAANLALPPVEITFAGGKLGIWNNDFKVDDNTPGEGGRNPTWRLTPVCD